LWAIASATSATASAEYVRAMSPSGSPLPSSSSARGSTTGSMPSRVAAMPIATVSPVVGGS
jgi:hypothetical protein